MRSSTQIRTPADRWGSALLQAVRASGPGTPAGRGFSPCPADATSPTYPEPMGPRDVWRLHHGGRVVASLHVTEADFPWLRAHVEPLDGFEALAPLLAEEARLAADAEEQATPQWVVARDRLRAATRLTRPDGREVTDYLLHVDGTEAWWRSGEEPPHGGPEEAGRTR